MNLGPRAKTSHRGASLLMALGLALGAAVCAMPTPSQAQDLNETLRQKNCFTCHAWDKKLVGPAYNWVRTRYTANDVPALAAKVLNGGRGVWGPIPMPANSQVNESEARFLVAGILGVGAGPTLPSGATYPSPSTTSPGTGSVTRSLGGGS